MTDRGIDIICALVWAMFTVGGCAWLVFGLGHSGWWFVLAILLATAWRVTE